MQSSWKVFNLLLLSHDITVTVLISGKFNTECVIMVYSNLNQSMS
jgi:hypothetical protein